MSKKKNYPVEVRGQKTRVRKANGRIVDSWPRGQPLKEGDAQITEEEWQAEAGKVREADAKEKATAAASSPPAKPDKPTKLDKQPTT